ncbi:MAG TPA: SGNH/GDSL hydrolase family protein [Propionibacteriaceae bacterium]
MTARGRRFLARFVTTLVAGLAGILTVALPAAADTVGIGQYVALGDSYAAGQGGSLAYDNNCLQSPNGYPALLDAENQIHLRGNAACTGATTSDVAEEQLSALKQGTRLVTLTVGAADLGLSEVLAACTAVPPTPTECQTEINRALALLVVPPGGESVLGGRLTDLYAEVADAAPNALIVVTGYPLLFELVQGDPTFDLKAQINSATSGLNLTIKTAVESAQNSGVNIVYVDVTEAFDGHGIGGSKEPFINPPEAGINAFHPTPAGYVAYAEAISAALPSSWGANHEQVA